MSDLITKHCVGCEGANKIDDKSTISAYLSQVPGWQLGEDTKSIYRTFSFDNFYEVIAFVNSVAWVAHTENHHPDMEISFKACTIHYQTHAVNGLTENDFIVAAKINHLL